MSAAMPLKYLNFIVILILIIAICSTFECSKIDGKSPSFNMQEIKDDQSDWIDMRSTTKELSHEGERSTDILAGSATDILLYGRETGLDCDYYIIKGGTEGGES